MNEINVPDIPWMHPSEINLIINHLNPEDTMLEWGCGGSTILFSQHVKSYYSLEHNKEWYDQVTKKIQDKGLTNIQFFHVPTNDGINKDFLPENEGKQMSHRQRYANYIQYPNQWDIKFDKILVDGRARQFCIHECANFLADDGLVFFHDFWMNNRNRYREAALPYFDEVASIVYSSQTLAVLRLKPQYKNGIPKDTNIIETVGLL
jgi:hypothetical protein